MYTQPFDLTAPFLEAHHELLAFLDGCDANQWHAIPIGEQRAVGVLAYHIAQGYTLESTLIRAIIAGQRLPGIYQDQAMLDRLNAADAALHQDCTRPETVAVLEHNAAATLAYIQGLREAELSRTAHVPILAPHFGPRVSVRQLVSGLLPGHIRLHLAEMRVAAGTVAAVHGASADHGIGTSTDVTSVYRSTPAMHP